MNCESMVILSVLIWEYVYTPTQKKGESMFILSVFIFLGNENEEK